MYSSGYQFHFSKDASHAVRFQFLAQLFGRFDSLWMYEVTEKSVRLNNFVPDKARPIKLALQEAEKEGLLTIDRTVGA